jgi:hypothetical protein
VVTSAMSRLALWHDAFFFDAAEEFLA